MVRHILIWSHFSFFTPSIPQKHARNERVTSGEELGTMSKNNFKNKTSMGNSLSYPASSLGNIYDFLLLYQFYHILEFIYH